MKSLKNTSLYFLQKFSKRFPPFMLLFISLLTTGLLTFFVHKLIESEESLRFDRAMESIVTSVHTPLRIYEGALNATQSFIQTDLNHTPESFDAFIEGLALSSRYPGLDEGIGYASRRSDGSFVVKYFKSIRKTREKVLGLNLSLDPEHKAAMAKARDKGKLTFSKKEQAGSRFSRESYPTFVLFLPVYDQNLPAYSLEEKQGALKGFIFSPTPARNLFAFILSELKADPASLRVRVYDGPKAHENELLFDSHPLKPLSEHPRYSRVISFPNHDWTFQLDSTPAFESPLIRKWVGVFFSLGVIISFLATAAIAVAKRLNEELQTDLLRKIQSEEKLLKARQEAEEANESKSRFLASMSHEIRTPLGIVAGFADLAMDHPNQDSELRKYLKTIKRNSLDLIALVSQILDISKIEANRMVLEINKFSLPQLLEEITFSLSLRAAEKNISLVWDQSFQIPEFIKTDSTKLRQILVNLINNAIKFTSKGGVRLTARLLSAPQAQVPMELEILVSDTGIGVNEQFKKNLFNAYTQAESSTTRLYGGTGLGLNLSKQLAQMLGGDVTLQFSMPNQGSVFSIRIKAGPFECFWKATESPQDKNLPHPPKVVSEKTFNKLKFLLAEDNTVNQSLFKSYLVPTGALLDLASDGTEAVQMASEQSYDLIILDIEMPHLNGYGALKFLREKGYTKPIIALSAHALQEERQRALESGFDAYLSKPILRAEFITEIHYILKTSLSGVKRDANLKTKMQ